MSKFCKKCGASIDEEAVICPRCGVQQEKIEKDEGGILWFLIGFLIPIVGLILWLIWRDDKPESAKSAGIGALMSLLIGVFAYVIMYVIIGAAFAGL